MNIFAMWIVRQGVEQIARKNWRGKVQYPMAAAVMTPAGFAFDVAVYLAHALRDHQDLLWQLVGANVRRSKEEFDEKATELVQDTSNDEKTLVNLWAYPRLRQLGVNPMDLDSMKSALNTNLGIDELEELIIDAWGQGLSMSLTDDEFVFDYQSASHEAVDEETWQEMRSHGLELSEKQDVMSLDERVGAYLGEAVMWATDFLSDGTAAELYALLKSYSGDERNDALSQASEAEFVRMYQAAKASPKSKKAYALITVCSTLSIQGIRGYMELIPELRALYRDNDIDQASRVMFVWTAWMFGAMNIATLETYCGSGWDTAFPERPEFPAEIAQGIVAQFKRAEEIRSREDGSFSVYQYELLHWLTAYALAPESASVPDMPMDMSHRGSGSIPFPGPDALLYVPSWLTSVSGSVYEMTDQMAAEF